MLGKIKIRRLQHGKVYISTDLTTDINIKDYKNIEETIKKNKSKINIISSLDWRLLKYLGENVEGIILIYLAYHITPGFIPKNKKQLTYQQLFIEDCDTWSFKCRWFAGFHPSKYNNSYREAFKKCSKNSANLYIFRKNKHPLYTLSDTLEKNKCTTPIKKTKGHFLSINEIVRLLQNEPEEELNKAASDIIKATKDQSYKKLQSHNEKLYHIRRKIEINTSLFENKSRPRTENNILSELFLLYKNIDSYFDSRCKELSCSSSEFEGKAYSFFNSSISVLEPIYSSDKQYKRTVSGKNIAVIAPNFQQDLISLDLSSFDVLVFFNSLPNNIPENKSIILSFAPSLTSSIPSDYKNEKIRHIVTSLRIPDFFSDNDRVLSSPAPFLFNTCPCSLQRFLYDLYSFNPQSVMIYGATLYIKKSGIHHNTDYQSSIENILIKKMRRRNPVFDENYTGFNQHDPLANFLFIKYLRKINFIECDETLSEILRMSPLEYLYQLFDFS